MLHSFKLIHVRNNSVVSPSVINALIELTNPDRPSVSLLCVLHVCDVRSLGGEAVVGGG